MYFWKSSPHQVHGYSFPNDFTKDIALDCSASVGFSGYAAVMLCRSVQEARPRASTSGGQSSGRAAGTFVFLPFVAGELEVSEAAIADQAAKEVQERQLDSVSYLHMQPSIELICLHIVDRALRVHTVSHLSLTRHPWGTFSAPRQVSRAASAARWRFVLVLPFSPLAYRQSNKKPNNE